LPLPKRVIRTVGLAVVRLLLLLLKRALGKLRAAVFHLDPWLLLLLMKLWLLTLHGGLLLLLHGVLLLSLLGLSWQLQSLRAWLSVLLLWLSRECKTATGTLHSVQRCVRRRAVLLLDQLLRTSAASLRLRTVVNISVR